MERRGGEGRGGVSKSDGNLLSRSRMTKPQAAACSCETDIAAPDEDAADLRKKS